MFLNNLKTWKDSSEMSSKEPLARFLKSYAVFITDHTGKEDKFFDIIEEKSSLSEQEKEVRIEQMMKLIEYLEDGEWMK